MIQKPGPTISQRGLKHDYVNDFQCKKIQKFLPVFNGGVALGVSTWVVLAYKYLGMTLNPYGNFSLAREEFKKLGLRQFIN